MRVMVTGAAGFIGKNLVEKLEDLEYKVYKVDAFSLGVPYRRDIFPYDVSGMKFIKKFRGHHFDVIFHFGAPCSVIQFNRDPVYCTRQTLAGFRNILRLAYETEATVIYPSSGNVYGPINFQEETQEVQPQNLYAVSKLALEDMASLCADLDTFGLRIFAGYGPGEEHKGMLSSAVTLFLNDMMQDVRPTIWGDGTQTRDFVYIDDITDAITKASEICSGHDVVNVGTGVPTCFNELIEMINKALKKKIEPIYVDKPANYVEQTKAHTEKMVKLLNIDPMPLEDGIDRYVQYKKNRK